MHPPKNRVVHRVTFIESYRSLRLGERADVRGSARMRVGRPSRRQSPTISDIKPGIWRYGAKYQA